MRDSTLCARLGVVCAAGCCARLGAVCAARLRVLMACALCDTVCAPHCVCGSYFAQLLHHYSETRMYCLALQIAASCWLVAVMAQVTINAADADVLKLKGL